MKFEYPDAATIAANPEWIRKHYNEKLFNRACEPLREISGSIWDPWTVDPVTGAVIFVTNPVYDAALADTVRCFDLYMKKQPFIVEFDFPYNLDNRYTA